MDARQFAAFAHEQNGSAEDAVLKAIADVSLGSRYSVTYPGFSVYRTKHGIEAVTFGPRGEHPMEYRMRLQL